MTDQPEYVDTPQPSEPMPQYGYPVNPAEKLYNDLIRTETLLEDQYTKKINGDVPPEYKRRHWFPFSKEAYWSLQALEYCPTSEWGSAGNRGADMQTHLGKRGSGGTSTVFAVAFTAIVIYVTVIVSGKLSVVSGSMFTTTSAPGMLLANNSQVIFSGLNIAAVGTLVLAGMMILSYLGMGWGKRR